MFCMLKKEFVKVCIRIKVMQIYRVHVVVFFLYIQANIWLIIGTYTVGWLWYTCTTSERKKEIHRVKMGEWRVKKWVNVYSTDRHSFIPWKKCQTISGERQADTCLMHQSLLTPKNLIFTFIWPAYMLNYKLYSEILIFSSVEYLLNK